MRGQALKTNLKRNYIFYALFIPVFVYYLIFHYKPLLGVVIAFKDYRFDKGVFGSPGPASMGCTISFVSFRQASSAGCFPTQ